MPQGLARDDWPNHEYLRLRCNRCWRQEWPGQSMLVQPDGATSACGGSNILL